MNTTQHPLNDHTRLGGNLNLLLYALASACMPFVAAAVLLLFGQS